MLDSLEAFARSLGKEPCVVSDLPGFIANRLGYATYREALHLLETGVANAATIDRAYRNAAGLWASFCGPFRWIDITGGPVIYALAMKRVLPELECATEVPVALQQQVEMDEQRAASEGSKAGTGF